MRQHIVLLEHQCLPAPPPPRFKCSEAMSVSALHALWYALWPCALGPNSPGHTSPPFPQRTADVCKPPSASCRLLRPPAAAPLQPHPAALARQEEFRVPYMKLFPKLNRSDFEKVWNQIDTNGDGQLSFEELATYYGFNISPNAIRTRSRIAARKSPTSQQPP